RPAATASSRAPRSATTATRRAATAARPPVSSRTPRPSAPASRPSAAPRSGRGSSLRASRTRPTRPRRRPIRTGSSSSSHRGGLNLFGPDGMLYVGMGDGGSGGDPLGNGQSNPSHLGKLLRFDVSTLPATPQHFAKGLRNPWRYAFDRATGDLYIADVGQNLFEEIDFVPAASLTSGLNYGWNIMEGRHCFNTANFGNPLPTCTMTGLTLPI